LQDSSFVVSVNDGAFGLLGAPSAELRMKVDIYLNFRGTCEQAFRFYEEHLGGKIVFTMTHGEGPEKGRFPAEWQSKMLHAQLELANVAIMGADVPDAEPMRSAYVSLTVDSDEEADRIYAVLSEGGQIFMKMEETFFASRFAMFRDRFGTSWMIQRSREGA
jgi:PhnB protein